MNDLEGEREIISFNPRLSNVSSHFQWETGVYLGALPALFGASLVSSEEPRCLQCDSILVPSPLELQDKPVWVPYNFYHLQKSAGLENPR